MGSFRAILGCCAVIVLCCTGCLQDAALSHYRSVGEEVMLLEDCGEVQTFPLVAGQEIPAGEVEVYADSGVLYVTFRAVMDLWVLEETQLHVGETVADIPQTGSGSPKIGQFDYSADHDPPVTAYTYTVDVEGLSEIVIATHAVMSGPTSYQVDQQALRSFFFQDVYISTFTFLGHPAYLTSHNRNAGPLNGSYPGFCVDLEHFVSANGVTQYQIKAVDSYDRDTDFLECMVDKPEHLDNLNYMINTYFNQEGAPGRELQGAVWTLMDDIAPSSPRGGIFWDQVIVDALVADAIENGEGYEPGCGDYYVILQDTRCSRELLNTGQNNQTTIIWKEVPCKGKGKTKETAWGAGMPFPGGSWATYMEYCIIN